MTGMSVHVLFIVHIIRKRMYVAHAYAQPANVRTYVRTFGQTVGADHEKCMAGIPLSAYVESHKDNF